MKEASLVIIGGGSAGLAAAISAYDQGIHDIVILEKGHELGGILNQCIHSGFGLSTFKEQLTGPEYAQRYIDEVLKRGIDVKLNTMVISMTLDKVIHYANEKEGYASILAKSIIMSVGCYERTAGAIQLPGDRPSGILTAGQAQLYLNIDGYLCGKRVFILGSGDIGLIMARRMTLEGAKVLGVAEIMPYSNGLNRNIVQCLHDYDIPLYLSHTVSNVVGKTQLKQIEISQVDENFVPIKGTEKTFDVDTLLLSVGLIPANDLLDDIGVLRSKTRGALVNQHLETSLPGVFSCGNGLHVHDLVDFVSEEGKLAGESAAKYLKGLLKATPNNLRTAPGKGIGYVLPQMIDLGTLDRPIALKYRVSKPVNNVQVLVKIDGEIIKKAIKPFLIPSEMETITIDPSLLKPGYQLSIEVEARV